MRPVYYPQHNFVYGIDGNIVSDGPLFLSPIAAVANGIALSQGPVTGALTLNGSLASGGVATLDVLRQVIVTSAGNDSGITFTITGTDLNGQVISETIAGGNIAAATSVGYYKTVTRIASSAATASTVTAGTNGVAASPVLVPSQGAPYNISLYVQVTGTVNYSVQQTFDSPWTPNAHAVASWTAVVAGLTSQTANAQATQTQPCTAYRLVINSNTPPGGAQIHLNENSGITAV
jgi:hypothetical protein